MNRRLRHLGHAAAACAASALAVFSPTTVHAAEPGPLLVATTNATADTSGVARMSFTYSFDPGLGMTDINLVSFDTALVYDTTSYSLDANASRLTYGGTSYSLANAVAGLGLSGKLTSDRPDAETFTSRTTPGLDVNLLFTTAKLDLVFAQQPGTAAGSKSNVFFTFNYTYHDPAYADTVLFAPQPLQGIASLTAGPVAAVPEASSLAMMLVGVGGLIGWRRKPAKAALMRWLRGRRAV